MKVKINKPIEFFGAHRLAESLLFFLPKSVDKYQEEANHPWVDKLGDILAYGKIIDHTKKVGETFPLFGDHPDPTWLGRALQWIHEKREDLNKDTIQIDHWDTWSMDHTLALIILPMLNQLQETKHGAPFVGIMDAPPHLAEEEPSDNGVGPNHFARWDWIIEQMIFSFEHILDDEHLWREPFTTGYIDIKWKQLEDGMSELMIVEEENYHVDYEGIAEYEARVHRGLVLFGKYFSSLWD